LGFGFGAASGGVASATFGVAGRGAGVRRGAGLRPRVLRAGAVGFSVSSADFSGFALGVSTGLASGVGSDVGSGVGAAATADGGGSGSAIVAPTELTRFVLRPVAVLSVGVVAGVSVSAMSGPPAIGSNEPLNERR